MEYARSLGKCYSVFLKFSQEQEVDLFSLQYKWPGAAVHNICFNCYASIEAVNNSFVISWCLMSVVMAHWSNKFAFFAEMCINLRKTSSFYILFVNDSDIYFATHEKFRWHSKWFMWKKIYAIENDRCFSVVILE